MILTVKNLTKKFYSGFSIFNRPTPFIAVNDISFDLKQGEILGFLGHNGAGKTTTIQMLLGLLEPSSGLINYFDTDFFKNRYSVLKKIGYANGYDRLPARLTVFENLDIIGRIYGMNKEDRIRSIDFLLQSLGMSKIKEKSVAGLSAGQSTCVMLVKAFMSNPDLVLLDEPTASLDPETAYRVREFILDKNKKDNTSILITSHNMNEVTELCDRVIILHEGKIVANDCPNKLANSMSNILVKLFFDIDFCFDELIEYLNSNHQEYIIEKNILQVSIEENHIALFLSHLAEKKIIYLNILIERPTFEDYFLQFLKKQRE
jgi:ABC-2 type transport system ATP-binding protein